MKKIKFTLKWRFTLLTVIIMTIASTLLITTINYVTNKRMSQLTGSIIVKAEDIILVNDIEGNENLAENIEPYSNISKNHGWNKILPTGIDAAIKEAESDIFTTSLIAFITIIMSGAIITYFIVDRALKPAIKLNENIKK